MAVRCFKKGKGIPEQRATAIRACNIPAKNTPMSAGASEWKIVGRNFIRLAQKTAPAAAALRHKHCAKRVTNHHHGRQDARRCLHAYSARPASVWGTVQQRLLHVEVAIMQWQTFNDEHGVPALPAVFSPLLPGFISWDNSPP